MKVRFAADVLNEPGAWAILDDIVHLFDKQRYWWDNELEEIEESAWHQNDLDGRAGKRNINILKEHYTDTLYPRRMHTKTLVVTLQGTSEYELPPDDARSCLGKPAYVAVENENSDGVFLKAMIHAFKRKELLDAQTEGWWEFWHLGGIGEVAKRIEHLRARTIGPLKVFVLSDSDRLYPGQEDTVTMQKVKGYCEEPEALHT